MPVVLVLILMTACVEQSPKPEAPATAQASATARNNPLLQPWTGPWGGVPPFGKFKVSDIKPAVETAMADNLAEMDKIAANPEPPSFENTIAAMERTGHELDGATAVYGVYTSTMNDAEMQATESDLSPKLAAFNDKIVQNQKLFARVDAVYAQREKLKLSPEQQRLLWIDWSGFVR